VQAQHEFIFSTIADLGDDSHGKSIQHGMLYLYCEVLVLAIREVSWFSVPRACEGKFLQRRKADGGGSFDFGRKPEAEGGTCSLSALARDGHGWVHL